MGKKGERGKKRELEEGRGGDILGKRVKDTHTDERDLKMRVNRDLFCLKYHRNYSELRAKFYCKDSTAIYFSYIPVSFI